MQTASDPLSTRLSLVRRLSRWLFTWRTARRTTVGLAMLATLAAVFYAEENWRGKRAWVQCKRELESEGAMLDWEKFVPPPVPDDQNFFKAPMMAEWFVGRGTNDLSQRLTNSATASVGATNNTIATPSAAHEYLKWSDQLTDEFSLIRKALARPYARIDTDYERPFDMVIVNFVTMRGVAQTLAQRTHCYLLLGRPEEALGELTLLLDLCRPLEGRPTGKPLTLVAAMINVAIKGLYANTIADGFKLNAWREPQLAALQQQLQQINLLAVLTTSLESEPAAVCHTLEITAPGPLAKSIGSVPGRYPMAVSLRLMPRGWIYQNMVAVARRGRHYTDGLDLAGQDISPHQMNEAIRKMEQDMSSLSPFKMIASISAPNFLKAWQTTARNQTLANEALIACGLELYRLDHGQYPETLEALVPQFVARLPHDLIGGKPLRYRRTAEGTFMLYSIGWNETDDGGTAAKSNDEGDWVWQRSGN